MSSSITNDKTSQVARFALDALAQRNNLIGHNLANVDTPGYRAQQVDFSAALRRATRPSGELGLVSTHAAHLSPENPASTVQVSLRQGGSLRADGNNVDIDVELSEMAETGISYQALSQLVGKKLGLLKYLASGR
jgi:flagellar basal-body rod protein FlgB